MSQTTSRPIHEEPQQISDVDVRFFENLIQKYGRDLVDEDGRYRCLFDPLSRGYTYPWGFIRAMPLPIKDECPESWRVDVYTRVALQGPHPELALDIAREMSEDVEWEKGSYRLSKKGMELNWLPAAEWATLSFYVDASWDRKAPFDKTLFRGYVKALEQRLRCTFREPLIGPGSLDSSDRSSAHRSRDEHPKWKGPHHASTNALMLSQPTDLKGETAATIRRLATALDGQVPDELDPGAIGYEYPWGLIVERRTGCELTWSVYSLAAFEGAAANASPPVVEDRLRYAQRQLKRELERRCLHDVTLGFEGDHALARFTYSPNDATDEADEPYFRGFLARCVTKQAARFHQAVFGI